MQENKLNTIKYSLNDHIATITIDRASKMNALNLETLQELNKLLLELQSNDTCWGLVITGSGEKAFAAGADISEFLGKSVEQGKELASWAHKNVFDMIANFPKPIIAAINGYALGGGLELALACHIRVATCDARLGFPEVSLGLIPGYGGTQRLPQIVGKSKAMEMILSGDSIDAQESLDWGLVNAVVPKEELLKYTKAKLNRMFLRSRNAITKAIYAINASYKPNKEGFNVEIETFGKLFSTKDFKEGVEAFINKRKPNFED